MLFGARAFELCLPNFLVFCSFMFVVFQVLSDLFVGSMDIACDLEVDVNGEEVFFVNKKIFSTFSGKLNKLLDISSGKFHDPPEGTRLRVIFHDLPGGPEAFELVTRFYYYSSRSFQITPSNACLLYFSAQFLEIKEDISSSLNLLQYAENSLKEIAFWTWPEVVNALKQCENCSEFANSSGIFDKVLDSIACRITTMSDTSPSRSSPESSAFRFSFDTRSTLSTKTGYHLAWWFEDIVSLNSNCIEKIVKLLIAKNLEHASISRFLFYFLKNKLCNAALDQKRKAAELVIDLLYTLDKSSISCKALFSVLQMCSPLNLSKSSRSKLENMIGSQINQATLDNLLIPSSNKIDGLYDIRIVLRFLKSFLNGEGRASMHRLKKVGSLVDLYMAEVAPDSSLRPSKFIAISTALPDASRDSHDAFYEAIDMYLQVHSGLSEEDKMKICCNINYEKLSSDCCKHLAQNHKFPSRTAIQALLSQQSKLKNLLEESNYQYSFDVYPCKAKRFNDDGGNQIILYAKKLDPSLENEKLRANLRGMQWRVMELEKVCKKMQAQMSKTIKTAKTSTNHHLGTRSLPRMCS